jgi:NAD-dependent dihydropyrimidine dehydrogenase PreA subunit
MSLIESITLLFGLTYAVGLLYHNQQKWGALVSTGLLLLALLLVFSWQLLIGALAGSVALYLLHKRRPELAWGSARYNTLRDWFQQLMGLAIVLVGVQFVVYYSLLANEVIPGFSRPDVVDAFLPIAGGLELRAIVTLGYWDQNHPAAAVMLFAVLLSGLVAKRAFCGWFCPLGLAGQYLYQGRKRLVGGDWIPPGWLDWPLRMLKYLLLAGLLYIVLLAMPVHVLPQYLNGYYIKIADLKTALFFISPGVIGGTVLIVVLLLAAWQKQAFCRYLCPYGAALGLLSFFSPLKIRRDTKHCLIQSRGIECDKCSRACPARIQVHVIETVRVDECQSCMRCVSACPQKKALSLRTRWGKTVSARSLLIIMLLVMFALPLAAHVMGFWHSQVDDATRMQLLKYIHQINH